MSTIHYQTNCISKTKIYMIVYITLWCLTIFRLIAEEEAKIRSENEKIKVLNKVRWIRWFKLVFYKTFLSLLRLKMCEFRNLILKATCSWISLAWGSYNFLVSISFVILKFFRGHFRIWNDFKGHLRSLNSEKWKNKDWI